MALPDHCDVLLIDDKPAILRSGALIGEKILNKHDLTIHTLLVGESNSRPTDLITEIKGHEVAETIMRLRPRLALSDFRMPGIDGLQILDGIKAVDAEWLQKRQEVLETGRVNRERLLFMINSGCLHDERIPAVREAYERGDLAFLLAKPMPLREILPLLAKRLSEQLTPEELAILQGLNARGIKDLLGLR